MNFQRIAIGLIILLIGGLAASFYMNWKTLRLLQTTKAFVEQGLGDRVVVEARPESESRDVVCRQPFHQRALRRFGVELHAGREDQLAAGEPGRRVGKLGRVHPADRRARAVAPGHEVEPHLLDKALDAQHEPTPSRSARGGPARPAEMRAMRPFSA